MDSRNIKAVKIWQNGVNTSANVLKLYNYGGYSFTNSESYVSYRLGKIITVPTIDDGTREEFVTVTEGSLMLPFEVVQNWGDDDQPIFDYVMQALNLTAA